MFLMHQIWHTKPYALTKTCKMCITLTETDCVCLCILAFETTSNTKKEKKVFGLHLEKQSCACNICIHAADCFYDDLVHLTLPQLKYWPSPSLKFILFWGLHIWVKNVIAGCVQKVEEVEQLLNEKKEYELEMERRERMREEAERLAEIEAERKKVGISHFCFPSVTARTWTWECVCVCV